MFIRYAIQKQDPVQVIIFVLKRAGGDPFYDEVHSFTLSVLALDAYFGASIEYSAKVRNRKAAFVILKPLV